MKYQNSLLTPFGGLLHLAVKTKTAFVPVPADISDSFAPFFGNVFDPRDFFRDLYHVFTKNLELSKVFALSLQ